MLSVEIKAVFEESRDSAGKRSIQKILQMRGIQVGLYLVSKIMKQLKLKSKQPRKKHYGKYGVENKPFENILARNFNPSEEMTVLCGDTTYIKVKGEWHYLAVVLNLNYRQVVGWKLNPKQDAKLVVDALNQAMLRSIGAKNILFHSDQGSIYGSDKFTQCVKQYGITQSMSRRGNCWDNASMER